MNDSTGNSSDVQKNADELIANISRLMAEAEEMLSESGPESTERIIRRQLEHAGARFAAKYDAAKAKICAAATQTDRTIRTYPYESVAVALGVGAVLGALFFRRRD